MDIILSILLFLLTITLASINYKMGKIVEFLTIIQRIATNLQKAGIVAAILGKNEEERLDIFRRALADKDVEL